MFGGYADIAAYYMDPEAGPVVAGETREGPGPVPPEYLPRWSPPDPWHQTGLCQKDFILIAEFSEQEGPKPLITIPRDTGSKFELGEFAVRIMSVDNQAVASETFTLTEDTQVVLSENQQGIHAYVHHFTLYDCQARGFVRPFCMSYISPDYSKLMNLYNKLTDEFGKVSHYFKYGSLLLFVKDMTHYLSDLQYTRERFLEWEQLNQSHHSDSECEDGPCDPTMSFDPDDEAILCAVTLAGLDHTIKEVKAMLDTTSSLLTDKALEDEFQQLEWQARDREMHSSSKELLSSSLRESDFHVHYKARNRARSGSFSELGDLQKWNEQEEVYRPTLVRTNKKRFEKSLRTLHELCKWGAREGVNKLRNLHMDLSRDWATLHTERKEVGLIEPSSGLLTVGKNVLLNMLSGLQQEFQPLPEAPSLIFSPTTPFAKSDSTDTLSSFKSAESFLSCTDNVSPVAGSRSTWDSSLSENNTSHHCSSIGDDDFTTRRASSTHSSHRRHPASNSCGGSQASTVESDHVSNISEISYTGTQNSSDLLTDTDASTRVFQKTLVTSIADQVSNWSPSCLGYGILRFIQQHSFSAHLLYSVLCGRPLVVAGNYKAEQEICTVVNALALFVPGHSSTRCAVVPFHVRALRPTDLNRFKLLGLGRQDRKSLESLVPNSLKKHISVLDLERKTLMAPPYQGGVITDIYKKRKSFSCEEAYVLYIHGVLLELAMKANLYYHCVCKDYNQESARSPEETVKLNKEQASFFAKTKVSSQDANILQYFAQVVKEQQTMGEDNEQHLLNSAEDVLPTEIARTGVKCSIFKS